MSDFAKSIVIDFWATVAGCALLSGILLDYIAAGTNFEIAARPGWMLPTVIKYASAIVLLAILVFAILSKRGQKSKEVSHAAH